MTTSGFFSVTGAGDDDSPPTPIPIPLTLPTRKLSLGCPILNTFLSGGLPPTLTELVGESAAGKTQLLLHLFSTTPSLYLHSSRFPLRRLLSLPPHPLSLSRPLHSPSHLLSLLLSPLPSLPILLDSIAGLVRSDLTDLRSRSGLLFKISSQLKRFAFERKVAVVVVNEVVDVVEEGGVRVGNYESVVSGGRRVVPALGLAWGGCVGMRIWVVREGDRRKMMVGFAPHLPKRECEFVVRREGVFGVRVVDHDDEEGS